MNHLILNLLNKLKHLIPSFFENDSDEPDFLNLKNKLQSAIEYNGWTSEQGSDTRFSFYKTFLFTTKKHANDFLLKTVMEKNSNHIHIELNYNSSNVECKAIVYSDDDIHCIKCLETCAHIDEEFLRISGTFNEQ